MINKDKLIQMINNLNDDGINVLLELFGDMDKKERYNINTTPERLAELQQIRKEKEELRKADDMEASLRRAEEGHRGIKEKKASLTGKEKRFFEVIENVNTGYYYMKFWELMLLSNIYDNNLINGSTDIFNYGFLKGQRAEKARQKRIREKVKAKAS